MSNFYIVFLGKRGGASNLIFESLQERKLAKQESSLILSQHFVDDSISGFEASRFVVRTPKRLSARQVFIYIKDVKLLLKNLNSHPETSIAYFVQSSPWDLLVKLLMKTSGIYIISGIHEVRHHPGDKWPTWVSTKMDVLLSNELVFWSDYVSKKIRTKKKRVVAKLPSVVKVSGDIEHCEEEYILGIGRIRKYKGFEVLVSAFRLDTLKDEKLLIAGEGKVSFATEGNTSVLNRWLSDEEIVRLIGNCKLVVFPYLEASQSGLIPIARQLKKRILFANVGGLSEQLANYEKAHVIESLEPKLLATQIKRLLT